MMFFRSNCRISVPEDGLISKIAFEEDEENVRLISNFFHVPSDSENDAALEHFSDGSCFSYNRTDPPFDRLLTRMLPVIRMLWFFFAWKGRKRMLSFSETFIPR